MPELSPPGNCDESLSASRPAITRAIAAWVMGGLVALAGAACYATLLKRFADFDFSMITVVTGFMVGRAIKIGGGPRAGKAHQVLAVLLTYGAIVGAYLAVRATFLFYDARALSPAALRPFHLLVLPIKAGARDRLLGVIYALALIVAWYASGGKASVCSKPDNNAHLPQEP